MQTYVQRRRRENRQGIAIVTASIAVVAAVTTGLWFNQAPLRDQHTLCLIDIDPPKHVVILVDQTDERKTTSNIMLRSAIARLASKLPVNARLTIQTFSGSPELPDPEIDICNVGAGEQSSWLWSNPNRLRKKFHDQYAQPIAKATTAIAKRTEAKHSHLVEALTTIAAQFAYRDSKVELIVFSDLRENSPAFSFYRSGRDISAFVSHLKSHEAARWALLDVHFVFTPIAKPAPHDEVHLRRIWTTALTKLGVTAQWSRL